MIDRENLLNEIANFDNAGVTALYNILPDPDIILNKKGETAKILNDVATDEQLTSAIMNRKNKVLLNERYSFKAGLVGDVTDERSDKINKMLQSDLENVVQRDIFSTILDAPFYGFSVLEIIWEIKDGFYRIKNIVDRPQHWFGFNNEGKLIFKGEHTYGDVVPRGKFLLARHFPTYSNPYGIRLLSRCLWAVAFKKGGVKFFTRFLEKYGIPHIVANAPQDAKAEERRAMASDLFNMVEDAVAVIPSGATVQFHSVTSNQADVFDRYIDRWNKDISKIIMGQTLTMDIGDTGSYAAANTHNDVAEDISKSDSLLVTSVMNELCWIYTQVNAKDVIAPTFQYIDNEDLKIRAELDKKLYDMGVTFNEGYFVDTYGLKKEFFKIRSTENTQPMMFAKSHDDIDLLLDNSSEIPSSLKAKLNSSDIKKLLESNATLDEMEDRLLELNFNDDEIMAVIKTVLINSHLKGVADA